MSFSKGVRVQQASAGQSMSKRQKLVRGVRDALHKGRLGDAHELLKAAPSKLRDDPEVQYLLGLVAHDMSRVRPALEHCKRSLKGREHPEPLLLAVRCARTLGETELGLDLCDRLERATSGDPIAAIMRGGLLEEAGRFDEALAQLEPMAERHRAKNEELPGALLIEYPKVLVQLKRFDEAVELIDRSLAIPDLPDEMARPQWHLRAKAFDRQKRYGEAMESAREASKIEKVDEKMPPLARVVSTSPCDVCGEQTVSSKLLNHDSGRICPACAQVDD